jgi:plasmid stabilization system protein ParE
MAVPADVEGTRQFVVEGLPYIVVYETEDEMITVLRIYHAAQDRPGSR